MKNTLLYITVFWLIPTLCLATIIESKQKKRFRKICNEYHQSRYVFHGKVLSKKKDSKNEKLCILKFKIDRIIKAHDFKMQDVIKVMSKGYFPCREYNSYKPITFILKKVDDNQNTFKIVKFDFSNPINYFDSNEASKLINACAHNDPLQDRKFLK
ncbi:MAG: hypothetical protein CME70_10415 [Halobacteriovorax sp.]|nr:hypothetical protein [Halobacteriovorax sp.]|tara:strand:+ start:133781 stop:134248 length:468 start_codon:yes stop_codon:yes gene_type:complete